MLKLSEMFGQRGGSDAFGRRAVKNIGIRTDIGQTFAETGTTNQECEPLNGLGDNETVSKDPDLKYKESRWTPEKGRDPWLDLYVQEVIQSVANGLAKKL